MNHNTVIQELHESMADPLSRKLAKAVIGWIEDRSPMGRLIIDLLEKAENGNFADGTPSLEDTTDKSLSGMGVTEVHITHMKLPEDCYYSHITLATQEAEEYKVLDIAVNTIFLEGSIKHIGGSALDALIVQRFAGLGAGASPCHAIDNFSRKRGRIIAKGRLLKHLKAAERGGA